ncbi:M23 family metallopeptidase [Flavobacteriales bacterium]|nr:M23 family metallopeptidase [Flavobacteriales bacterium]
MQDKEGLNNFWKKLLHKYRFVIITDDSFEEKLSVKLNRLNIFSFAGIFVFICFFSALLLIAYTPLKEYVPGKSTTEVQKSLIELNIKTDSLERALISRGVYLQNITNIINGDELITTENTEEILNSEKEIFFEKSIEDSLLRVKVEAEDKSSIIFNKEKNNEFLMFYPPLDGIITDKFNNKTRHFGVDLVAKEKSRITTVLEGTIIVSHWTSETGYVIGVQHKNDFISLYKHNSVLLKEVGDFVNAGDHIAIIGNSGELSTGPHLHFELWHKGIPVNPENYISF